MGLLAYNINIAILFFVQIPEILQGIHSVAPGGIS